MRITLESNVLNGSLYVNLNGKQIGWADYNAEDELVFNSMVALTPEQLITVATCLREEKNKQG